MIREARSSDRRSDGEASMANEPELQNRFRELLHDISRFSEAGETKSALVLLRSAQQIAGDFSSTTIRAQALNELGFISFKIGALQDTESAFQQVLSYSHGNVAEEILVQARIGLGLFYYATKRFLPGPRSPLRRDLGPGKNRFRPILLRHQAF